MKRLLAFLLVVVASFAVIAVTTPGLLRGTKLGLDLKGGFEILYEAEPLTPGGTVTREALKQAAISLEKRANRNGVAEPEVITEGSNRIRVKIADVADEQKVRDLMQRPAELQFRSADGCKPEEGYCKVELDGSDFVEGKAKVAFDELNRPVVEIEVKKKEKFAEITTRLVGKPLAIYLDDELISAPIVQQPLTDGKATITGQETIEEARNLAEIINLGALPLKLTEKYAQSIGPTLGQQSLQQTLLAGAVASVIILVFMSAFYRVPGMVASICLIIFTWLLLAVFYLMGATLTLPGIAAFILGMGMAVDSNIISAERIRDELRHGKSIPSAFKAGSKRSFRTIIDAHLTTVIAGAVLYVIGAGGPVRSFAIVLIASLVVNLVTNVALTRFLLQLLVESGRLNKLSHFGVKEREVRAL
jgi:preprotein translocase subunit SecD